MNQPPINIMQFAMNSLQNNPNVQNSEMGRTFMNILQNNDSKAGEEMANNILRSYGLSQQDGIQQAQNGLMQMMMNQRR